MSIAVQSRLNRAAILSVLVSALGYFVDIYDLLLFSIVRVESLKSLGIGDHQLMSTGVFLINSQMAGLLLGGILWGILGDKRGRRSVLFGSIFLYSVANILNAFVTNVDQYALLRFIAGIGLAGELGAAVTLVSEILPQRIRGYGTSIIASVGILGAVFAGLIADVFNWRTAYLIGGVLGFTILVLRGGVRESQLFHKTKNENIIRGDFFSLFKTKKIFSKYLAVILIGVPIWYVVGILVTFTPEFGKAFEMQELPTAGKAVIYCYLGLAIGDLASGLMSQFAKSRKKIILLYILITIAAVASHLTFGGASVAAYYSFCVLMGFGAGYWAMFVTVAAEQFGTNLRSTVTTTAPNFVRGSVIPLTLIFQAAAGSLGVIGSSVLVGTISFGVALISLTSLEETFHKNLDYVEPHQTTNPVRQL